MPEPGGVGSQAEGSAAAAAETVLELTGVEASYGRIPCLRGVDLEVRRGSIVALIGANGAGKTTTLRAISGLLRPTAGAIRYQGRALGRLPAHERVRRGIVQVPEGRAILGRMSVLENLELGAFGRRERVGSAGRARGSGSAVPPVQSVQSVRDDLEAALERFPRLAERRRQPAGTLSGGEQQMLAIARALMARPEILLMDEPSMGLAPRIVAEVFALIESIHREGTTILLVEQNARQALAVADWAYVLETGRTVLSGPAAEVRHDPRVTAAYLGGG